MPIDLDVLAKTPEIDPELAALWKRVGSTSSYTESPEALKQRVEQLPSTLKMLAPTAGFMLGGVPGGMAGEGVNVLAERLTTPEEDRPSVGWGLGRMGLTGAIGAGAGLVGRGVGKAVGAVHRKILSPFAKKLTPIGQKLIDTLGYENVRPYQAVQSRLQDVLRSFAESSFFGGGRMQVAKETQEASLKQVADQLIGKLGTKVDPFEGGLALSRAAKLRDAAAARQGGRLYEQVDEIAEGLGVPLTELKAFLSKEAAKRGALPKTLSGTSGTNLLDDILKTYGERESIPFSQAHYLRSELGKMRPSLTDPRSDVPMGIASKARKLIDKAMTEAGLSLKPEVLPAYQTATQFWKEKSAISGNRLIRRILKTTEAQLDPEQVTKMLLAVRTRTGIEKIRAAVGPTTFKKYQGMFAQDLFNKASTKGGELSAKALSDILEQRVPASVLDSTFGRAQANNIREFAQLLKQTQDPGTGAGRIFIQLKQAGVMTEALGVLLGGTGAVGLTPAAVIVAGPYALSRIFTNPSATRWLTSGIKAQPGTREAAEYATKLLVFLKGEQALQRKD